MLTKTIEEVTEILIDYRGKTPPKTNYGVKLITAKIIKDGFVQNSNLEYISEETYETWMRRGMPRQWDILITTEAPLGEVAQLRTTEKIALAQRVILLRGNPQIINQQYYFQALKSSFVQSKLQMRATGTTVAGIKQSELRQVEIPYYPLPVQRKIAAALSAYDDLIENNTRRIKILEEMAEAVYQEWFVKFRFPGHEGVEMVESEVGSIPQGWNVKPLGKIVSEIIDYRGKTPKKLGGDWDESGIMALSAVNVKQGKLVNLEKAKFVSEQLYEKWMKSEIAKNDILITSEAPLGETYYLIEKKKICLSQRLYCIRANPNIIKPSLLFYAISSPSIQSQLHANATGTTVLGIRQTALRKISVIIPPVQLQGKAESVLETLITLKETLEKKNTNLRLTRDLLLPKLISGEIDIFDLDIDTP